MSNVLYIMGNQNEAREVINNPTMTLDPGSPSGSLSEIGLAQQRVKLPCCWTCIEVRGQNDDIMAPR